MSTSLQFSDSDSDSNSSHVSCLYDSDGDPVNFYGENEVTTVNVEPYCFEPSASDSDSEDDRACTRDSPDQSRLNNTDWQVIRPINLEV